jgi:hypothetical protein
MARRQRRGTSGRWRLTNAHQSASRRHAVTRVSGGEGAKPPVSFMLNFLDERWRARPSASTVASPYRTEVSDSSFHF